MGNEKPTTNDPVRVYGRSWEEYCPGCGVALLVRESLGRRTHRDGRGNTHATDSCVRWNRMKAMAEQTYRDWDHQHDKECP